MSEYKITGEYPDLESLRRAGHRTFEDEQRSHQEQMVRAIESLRADIRKGAPMAAADSLATKPKQWVCPRCPHLKGTIEFSDDYRILFLNSKRHSSLTPRQAAIVRVLINSDGYEASTQTLIDKAGCGKISNSFRGKRLKLWKTIVGPVGGCKGLYKLELTPKK
jgi:hypothetical protein